MVRGVVFLASVLGLVAVCFFSACTKKEGEVEYRLTNTDEKPLRLATSAEYPQLPSSQFCPEYQVYSKDAFDAYSFPRSMTEKCRLFEGDGIIVAKHQSSSLLGSMPVLMVSPARSSTSAPITVLLVGGPHDSIFTGLDSHLTAFLRALVHETGGPVLVPAYYGTGPRSVYPRPDLDVAKLELESWLIEIQSFWPARKISVVGFSSGSLLAFDIFQKLGLRTVLVSAPPVSIAELYRLRNVDFIYGSMAERARRGAVNAFDLRDGRAVYAGIREAPLADLNRAFFGRHYAERTWTRELRGLTAGDRACLRVIFGSLDETIAKEVFFEEGLDRLVSTTVVANVGHASETSDQAQALASAIADAAGCSGGAGRRAVESCPCRL